MKFEKKKSTFYISRSQSYRCSNSVIAFDKVDKKNDYLICDILLRSGGEIEEDFCKNVRQLYHWEVPYRQQSIIVRGLKRLLKGRPEDLYQKKLGRKLASNQYDLIYVNSVASSDTLVWIRQYIYSPVILHVHELEFSIQQFCNLQAFQQAQQYVSVYLVVSKIVQENLIKNHKISEEKTQLVYEFIPSIVKDIKREKKDILQELNISPSAFIVGGSGSINWRKGNDLFIQVAKVVYDLMGKEAPIYFLWLGGYPNQIAMRFLQYDIEQLGLSDKVLFPGSYSNPIEYFNIFDLFLMTSKEDPFPLVCLEAAQLGKPIICFEKGVGSAEFIDNEVGALVPYMDIQEMAEAVLSFYRDIEKTRKAGEQIKLKAKDFTVDVIAPKILKIMQDVSTAKS